MHSATFNSQAITRAWPAHAWPGRLHAALVTAALAAVLTGCTGLADFLGFSEADDDPMAATEAQIASVASGGEELAHYLTAMRLLSSDNATAQEIVYRDAASALDREPSTTNRLRMALIHAVPGHPWSDAQQAHGVLQQLLADDNALLPAERTLAGLYLQHTEQTLMLRADIERLRSQSAEALQEQQATSARELDAAMEENRRLHEELEDAHRRLDAIANIERSIRERENGSDSP